MTVKTSGKITGKQVVALICFSILILFIFLEVSIRFVGVLKGSSFFYPFKKTGEKATPFIPFRTFGLRPYQTIDGVRYISSRHKEKFLLKKPNGTVRIVCFGGSTTENLTAYKIEKVHYPLVLQSILEEKFGHTKFEVINVSYSAYATPHSLILLELDVLFWEPDIVILSHNINDLSASYWPNLSFDYSNKYSDEFYTFPGTKTDVRLMERSRLISFFKPRFLKLIGGETYPLIMKSQGNKPSPLAEKIFQRNLRSFVTLAQSNGIQVVLGTQALQPSEDMLLKHFHHKPYNYKVIYPLHEELNQHHRVFNELIKKVSLETGSLVVDNDLVLGGKMEYFHDHVHYTVAGVKQLAESYADVLSKSKAVRQLISTRQSP